MDGTWGDEPELQALCELYNRPAEVWAFHPTEGAALIRRFNANADGVSSEGAGAGRVAGARPPIRLSFAGGGHYDSVIPFPAFARLNPTGASNSLRLLRELESVGQLPFLARIPDMQRALRASSTSDWEANLLRSPPGTREEQMLRFAALRRAQRSSGANPSGSGAGMSEDARAIAASMSEAQQREAEEINAAVAESRRHFEAQDDDEDLEAALRASIATAAESTSSSGSMAASAGGGGAGGSAAALGGAGDATSTLDEDAQMQLALQQSLADHQHDYEFDVEDEEVERGAGTHSHPSSGGSGGPPPVHVSNHVGPPIMPSAADQLYEATLHMSEDDQLQCAIMGLTAAEFLRLKGANASTASSASTSTGVGRGQISSKPSFGAAGAVGSGGGRPPSSSIGAMDVQDEDADLALALLLSTQQS